MRSIFKPIGIIRVFPTLEKNLILPGTMSPPKDVFAMEAVTMQSINETYFLRVFLNDYFEMKVSQTL